MQLIDDLYFARLTTPILNLKERINMVGGNGGQPFRDAERQSNLRQINIRCGTRVDSLQCIYADGSSTAKHGGSGGKDEIFALDLGQYDMILSR